MHFSGPDPADFANVRRLNHAFLERLRHPTQGGGLRKRLSSATGALAARLSGLEIERLAETPFLLLSLRERDEDFWRVLMAVDLNLELFECDTANANTDQLGAAALSFLWQLAQRNPYAARLVSGATLAWCERLSECTLLDLLQRTANIDNWIEPRLAGNEVLWVKLLGQGRSADKAVRRAAQLTALQVVLTSDPVAGYESLRAAACSVAVPSLNVADPGQRR